MLKRINADQVQLGMYVRKFEGSWFVHPFWWARFVVRTEKALARIRGSGVDLWIDSGKGLDVAEAAAPGPARVPAANARPREPPAVRESVRQPAR